MHTPQVGDFYRHFKGNTIEIIAIGKHTENLEEMVVYTHAGETWVRPMDMFLSKVDKGKYPDVEQEDRFEWMEEA